MSRGFVFFLRDLTIFVGNLPLSLGTMSNDDSDIDPVELEVLEANDNSTISTPSRPIPPSISAVWDHPLIELVHIPSTPGKSDGYYWRRVRMAMMMRIS